jgi:ElaB/YqjD/DUF883 family membrane-anchored ribosome-binding protein
MINRLSNGVHAARPQAAAETAEPRAAKEFALGMGGRFHEVIAKNPKTSLAAALVAGVLLGWLMKRR